MLTIDKTFDWTKYGLVIFEHEWDSFVGDPAEMTVSNRDDLKGVHPIEANLIAAIECAEYTQDLFIHDGACSEVITTLTFDNEDKTIYVTWACDGPVGPFVQTDTFAVRFIENRAF